MHRQSSLASRTIIAAGLALAAFCGSCPGAEPGSAGPSAAANFDRAAALAELRDFTLAGMDRRLGPGYRSYHGPNEAEKFPNVWLAPARQGPGGRRWQIGGPWTREAGDFSSTQGQVLYAPDPGFFPVDRVTILEWSNGCFTESPEPPWHGGFRPEPAAAKWQQAAPNGKLGQPIAMARGMGYWANNGLAVFSSGLVAAAGTVTARGLEPTFQFPPDKLPTAISITNKSEFVLVTVHDLSRHIGQVAVLSPQAGGSKTHFVHEWQDEQAWSLPSVALFTNLKLLGYIDLPGIEFPTGVCAVGNDSGGRMNGRDGNAGLLREYNLAVQADRDVFLKGPNAGYSSTAGFAVVIGKRENKAAFLDLKPLFQRVRAMYFTTEENYRKTRNAGLSPQQWPYAFDVDPTWKPSVVKVIDVPAPTAVIASLRGGEKVMAMIASLDGTVGVYHVGGLGTAAPASADEIRRAGEVKAGRNITCLTYHKGSQDTLIAVSRGDREIEWIQTGQSGPHVVRRLRDARLKDPVFAEMSDTHGIETSLVTVADFTGRKIINYRCSRVVFATQGGAKFDMGPGGKDEFECGGVLELPGAPFSISATNVN